LFSRPYLAVCYGLAVGAVSMALALAVAPAAWAFPWSIDMFRGQTIQPLAVAPRVMPKGTMPTTGGMPPMSREEMTVKLHNPLKPTPENIAHGKALFMTTCSPCHGTNGKGKGTVAHLLRTPPADLVSGLSKDLPDGYIYGTIRDGGIAMPSYDDAMSSRERWQVVLFVRSLEHSAAQASK
jgi:mono/diheme cytochrome c family protein